MYNELIGSLIAEETRTGAMQKPNYNNSVTKNRKALGAKIKGQALELGRDVSDVSLDYINQSIPELQRFVTLHGEQPLKNPAELATQAFLLRQKDIKSVANTLGCSEADAQTYIEESEAKAEEINSSDADNFIGGLIEAVSNVAHTGLQKLADKRTAKGKKPGVLGFLANATDTGASTSVASPGNGGGGLGEGIKIAAKEVLDSIKEAEKKKAIKKMLPIAIVGIVVLILVVVLITRNATKH